MERLGHFPMEISGIKRLVTVDPLCPISIINESLIFGAPCRFQSALQACNLLSVSDNIRGVKYLTVQIASFKITHQFFVVRNYCQGIVLGNDYLQRTGFKYNSSNNTFSLTVRPSSV
jgi:hypothetical protein